LSSSILVSPCPTTSPRPSIARAPVPDHDRCVMLITGISRCQFTICVICGNFLRFFHEFISSALQRLGAISLSPHANSSAESQCCDCEQASVEPLAVLATPRQVAPAANKTPHTEPDKKSDINAGGNRHRSPPSEIDFRRKLGDATTSFFPRTCRLAFLPV
jgi:hypothetical protein